MVTYVYTSVIIGNKKLKNAKYAESKLQIHRVLPFSKREILIEIAHNWIYDEVGRNNYIERLHDTCEVAQYNFQDYVLRYEKDNQDRINIWWIQEISSWTGTYYKPWLVGWFEIATWGVETPAIIVPTQPLNIPTSRIMSRVIQELDEKFSTLNN